MKKLLVLSHFNIISGNDIKKRLERVKLNLELLYLNGHQVKGITYLNRNYFTRKKSLRQALPINYILSNTQFN